MIFWESVAFSEVDWHPNGGGRGPRGPETAKHPKSRIRALGKRPVGQGKKVLNKNAVLEAQGAKAGSEIKKLCGGRPGYGTGGTEN